MFGIDSYTDRQRTETAMGEKCLLNSVEEFSVVDVYDLASDIGKECEKIIDIFGADAVTSLMPKVMLNIIYFSLFVFGNSYDGFY